VAVAAVPDEEGVMIIVDSLYCAGEYIGDIRWTDRGVAIELAEHRQAYPNIGRRNAGKVMCAKPNLPLVLKGSEYDG
jgi:hypothetical protein